MKLSILIPVFNREDTIERCINSIPKRDDIEIVVCDDGSTDGTLKKLEMFNNIKILKNETNKGVGFTMNRLYDNATGEYMIALGSDDYFIEGKLDEFIKELDGTDLVYFNMINDEEFKYTIDKKSKMVLVGSVKALKRDFVKETRCPELRVAEDYYFYKELLKKKPTEKYTHILLKHYTTKRTDRLSIKGN